MDHIRTKTSKNVNLAFRHKFLFVKEQKDIVRTKGYCKWVAENQERFAPMSLKTDKVLKTSVENLKA